MVNELSMESLGLESLNAGLSRRRSDEREKLMKEIESKAAELKRIYLSDSSVKTRLSEIPSSCIEVPYDAHRDFEQIVYSVIHIVKKDGQKSKNIINSSHNSIKNQVASAKQKHEDIMKRMEAINGFITVCKNIEL